MKIRITKLPSNTMALGGVLQTHGSDWNDGLTVIGAGGSHESNPYDGVQLGRDENFVPNLVEEGEVVFNDYVYSKRIKLDAEAKDKFHFAKKKDITYADAAKKLEKEISERPNDPISKAGFNAQMETLAEEQERQKQEMEAKRAKEAFEALSPEEQTMIMQQAEANRQQTIDNSQQMAEQAPMTQPMENGELMMDNGMPQEEIPQEQMMQQEMPQGQPMMACGGKINKYPDGGQMKKYFSNMLKLYTDSDIDAWAKKNNVGDIDWENVLQNENFVKAITKDNPVLADAIARGYDFGAYSPSTTDNVTFDNDRGNWDMQTVQGWWGSQDPAWLEVIQNHPEITKDTTLDKKTLENYLSSTEAFKKGTQWLQASPENRFAYLKAIYDNPNAPKAAKRYAERFIDGNGWKQGAATDYDTIFNNPSGRAANPGTYWKTPIEAVRGSQTVNLVQGPNGWEEIIGDVPADWKSLGNYSWATPQSDFAYNYYERPAEVPGTPASARQNPGEADKSPVGNGVPAGTPETDARNIKRIAEKYAPLLKAEWPRYAGLAGPAIGLGMQLFGVGRPDTKNLDKLVESFSTSGTAFAAPKYIGDYLGYRPMDIWAEQNRLNANTRATDRAIQNNAAPIGTKIAGLVANEYANQIGSGNLYRQALEYNDAKRKDVAEFNRNTNQFNADSYNKMALANMEAYNRSKQYAAQLGMQAEAQKMAADAGWYNSIYGNISGLLKGIGDLGRENAQHNMIARMAADGLFGNLGDSYTGSTYVTKKKAKGGKISKKKGLTF